MSRSMMMVSTPGATVESALTVPPANALLAPFVKSVDTDVGKVTLNVRVSFA